MKGLVRGVLYGWLMLVPCWVMADESEQLAEQAHEVVENTTRALLAAIDQNRDLYESDVSQFYWRLEDIIGPMVDFKRLTRRIMGKHYRDASIDQRKRFASAFRRSLLRSYATGLIEFDDYDVRMLPPKKGFEHNLRNTLVDLEVVLPSGRVFPITQSMYFHHRHRRWMAQNVIVDGINVGKLFNEQFDQMTKDNDGDIEAAINTWIDSLQEQGRKLRSVASGKEEKL